MHVITRLTATVSLLFLLATLGLARPSEAKKSTLPSLPSGTQLDALALARHIDQSIAQRLQTEQVQPSPRADDAEFLRRVYLDLTGTIPAAEKAAAFLDSQATDKRAKLIEDLLASPQYGRHLADIWQALLLPRSSDNRRLSFDPTIQWLADGFKANKPWDQMVREILTATGDMDKNPAVAYYFANPTADKLTDNVTRVFLGVQLQCAQCHNHPFTEWKQTEYWGMATFFSKVRREGRPNQAAKQGGTLGITESGRGKQAQLPESAKIVPAKFLQGEQPQLNTTQAYRPVLANWLTSPRNRFFSRAMVNRTWAQLFGRGFVHPVDDMHDGNVASHPELLADLAEQFAVHGFDLKYLYRAVCNSQAYQHTSKPFAGNEEAAPELFSHLAIKVLTPEQLYDSLAQVVGTGDRMAGRGRKAQAQGNVKGQPNNPRAAFVAFFGVEDGSDPTEYQAGIPQALRLMNSPNLNNLTSLAPLLKSGRDPASIIEHLYLAVLSRRPTPAESERVSAYVRRHQNDSRQVYGDVLWALLNSSEFTLNH
jgi:hypothetical protein